MIILSQCPQPDASLWYILSVTPSYPTPPHLVGCGVTNRDHSRYSSHAVILGTRYAIILLGVIKLFVLIDININSFQHP